MFNILVVEDDMKLRNLFCTVLLNNGYCAIPAESGLAALKILDTEYVDLIISDIMMPGMDGYELIETLRVSGYTLPILIITAKERFEDKQRGFLAGTDDYMVKPIDVNEMVLRIGALLKRARISTERKIICGKTVGASAAPEGILPFIQTDVLSQQDLYPPAADGRNLGRGFPVR